MVLSRKLRTLRKKMGFSQLELSEKLSVSRQAVSSWEAGTSKPSVENLQSLSTLYHVSIEYLLDDTQELFLPTGAEEEAKADTKQQFARRDVKKWQKHKWFLIAVFFFALSLCFAYLYLNEKNNNKNDYNMDEMEVEKGVPPANEKFDLTWE